MSSGTLFVVTGPSGAGKGTVLRRLFCTLDDLYYSVSLTTRPPREGERHGVDYFFHSADQVKEMIAAGQMLEYAQYVGHTYGTPARPVDAQLAEGRDVILEIEVQGALQVKAARSDAVLVFIAPPSFEELERRLRGRGTECEDMIAGRLSRAREEQAQIEAFHYIVLNSRVEQAADELRAIIVASRCKTDKRRALLKG